MTVADFLSFRQFLIAVGFSAGPLAVALAQLPSLADCAPRADLVEAAAAGLADSGTTVIDILSSPGGETWTLLYSLSTGRSFVIAGARRWEIQTQPAALGPGA